MLLMLAACGSPDAAADSSATAPAAEQEEEMNAEAGEWTELFNGTDLTGWHNYGGEGVGPAWQVKDGAIYLAAGPDDDGSTPGGGDIVTDRGYDNYELELEWKISECGNSGIIYNVQESPEYGTPWMTGPEMQVLDNDCHPDGKIKTHRTGDLYDMVSIKNENAKPVGEWNSAKLIVTRGRVEHWLNGEQQIVYANTGDEWTEMIGKSKFKDMDKWGMFTDGKISLQDHGDPVWFRNIRLRQLSK